MTWRRHVSDAARDLLISSARLSSLVRLTITRHRLRKVSSGSIDVRGQELLLFSNLRNEAHRIPRFLEYYRSKGVDKFFFVDNRSEDDTANLLLPERDVYLFQTSQPYSQAGYGLLWQKILADRYGRNTWCLFVDLDEIFVYPHWEDLSIKDVCHVLEQEHKDAMKVLMLDMYSDEYPSLESNPGVPLWRLFHSFDRQTYYARNSGGISFMHGGVRERVFHASPCLTKFPLVKYSREMVFESIHKLHNIHPSSAEGALLHFKFDSSFAERTRREVERGEHWQGAAEYRMYASALDRPEGPPVFFSPDHTARFEDSQQLIRLGIMKTSDEFEGCVRQAGLQRHIGGKGTG